MDIVSFLFKKHKNKIAQMLQNNAVYLIDIDTINEVIILKLI